MPFCLNALTNKTWYHRPIYDTQRWGYSMYLKHQNSATTPEATVKCHLRATHCPSLRPVLPSEDKAWRFEAYFTKLSYKISLLTFWETVFKTEDWNLIFKYNTLLAKDSKIFTSSLWSIFSVHADLQTELTIPRTSNFAKPTANPVASSVCYLIHKFEQAN